MPVVECPHCLSDLRIPPMSELGALGAAFSDEEMIEGIALRCKFCRGVFPVPSEAQIEREKDELRDLVDQLRREMFPPKVHFSVGSDRMGVVTACGPLGAPGFGDVTDVRDEVTCHQCRGNPVYFPREEKA